MDRSGSATRVLHAVVNKGNGGERRVVVGESEVSRAAQSLEVPRTAWSQAWPPPLVPQFPPPSCSLMACSRPQPFSHAYHRHTDTGLTPANALPFSALATPFSLNDNSRRLGAQATSKTGIFDPADLGRGLQLIHGAGALSSPSLLTCICAIPSRTIAEPIPTRFYRRR